MLHEKDVLVKKNKQVNFINSKNGFIYIVAEPSAIAFIKIAYTANWTCETMDGTRHRHKNMERKNVKSNSTVLQQQRKVNLLLFYTSNKNTRTHIHSTTLMTYMQNNFP